MEKNKAKWRKIEKNEAQWQRRATGWKEGLDAQQREIQELKAIVEDQRKKTRKARKCCKQAEHLSRPSRDTRVYRFLKYARFQFCSPCLAWNALLLLPRWNGEACCSIDTPMSVDASAMKTELELRKGFELRNVLAGDLQEERKRNSKLSDELFSVEVKTLGKHNLQKHPLMFVH